MFSSFSGLLISGTFKIPSFQALAEKSLTYLSMFNLTHALSSQQRAGAYLAYSLLLRIACGSSILVSAFRENH
ncbi:MAG: hypothetical protein COW65_10360 [Cytophagales bacterium CG18_big_fil_WC_8_21_14_2_50_42_9]|nr:MAG: hypothetical protein COW65_10360 [Cytophagales bacterium CG18_big_fil_WC_8_21_14_2_50_42_9]